MIKTKNIFVIAAAALLAAACSSDEEFAVTHPDGWDEINFTIGGGAVTRADITYIPYDFNRDPHTMGVFGYHDLSAATIDDEANKIFYNTEVTATLDDDDVVTWSYPNKKYWFDYALYNSFDFFGLMPYNENATLTTGSEEGEFTLTMPVSFPNGAVFSPVETALVCAEPQHMSETGGTIPFRMDQTLTGYALRFQLGDQMDELRDFIIKDVRIYGESLAYSGTVSRTYTYSSNKWISGDITWTDVLTKNLDVNNVDDAEAIISVPYVHNPQDSVNHESYYIDNYGEDEANDIQGIGALRVTKKLVQWGIPIYVIPNTTFNPIIEVTYDVVVQNEAGEDIVTRKDVKSTIKFGSEVFGEQSLGKMGFSQPVRIKIIPDYLYVLADADQTFGYLLVSED